MNKLSSISPCTLFQSDRSSVKYFEFLSQTIVKMDVVANLQESSSPQTPDSPSAGRRITKMMADLSKKIIRRQTPEELIQKNILPGKLIDN